MTLLLSSFHIYYVTILGDKQAGLVRGTNIVIVIATDKIR